MLSQIDQMTYEGTLHFNQSLKSYNSWRVGGAASYLYVPQSAMDLSAFLKQWPINCSLLWLGLGSNVLIRDIGFHGLAILTPRHLNHLSRLDRYTVRAESGVISAKMARFCAQEGLGESAFFAGIPGTIGGALAMNASAFGGVTWDHVQAVETIDRYGEVRWRTPADFTISYREVTMPQGEWFLAGYFQFPIAEPQQQKQAIKQLLSQRQQTQPIGKYNCGSVFRNPDNAYAAQLIEQAGFKGHRVGGAYVSQKHANFIINDQHASSHDIESLIGQIQSRIYQEKGIELRREVHIY